MFVQEAIFEKFLPQLGVLFAEMAPFLLLGFLLAGIIHVWIPNRLYIPKIAKPNLKSVVWAALFGVPLPICSCGVIPTAIALRREGASYGTGFHFSDIFFAGRAFCLVAPDSGICYSDFRRRIDEFCHSKRKRNPYCSGPSAGM